MVDKTSKHYLCDDNELHIGSNSLLKDPYSYQIESSSSTEVMKSRSYFDKIESENRIYLESNLPWKQQPILL